MATKGVEIYVHPSFIVPSVVLLNVIAMVVAIYMVADTLVILTGDRESVDIDRDVLVQSMVDHSGCAEATVFSIDRKSTRLNSSHSTLSRMPSSA